MFDALDIDWMWMLVGFIVGICSAWFISDLVFPVIDHEDDDE
jgi:hypothetical protein